MYCTGVCTCACTICVLLQHVLAHYETLVLNDIRVHYLELTPTAWGPQDYKSHRIHGFVVFLMLPPACVYAFSCCPILLPSPPPPREVRWLWPGLPGPLHCL